MLIRKNRPGAVKSSEITPKSLFLDRRRFLKTAALAGAGVALSPLVPAGPASFFGSTGLAQAATPRGKKLDGVIKSPWQVDEEWTSYDDITGYNNFYEFSTDKAAVARLARDFKTRPWAVQIAGEAARTGTFDLDDVLKGIPLEDRVYRFRCVEAWSMVVPWVGVPLASILKKFEPTSRAKYVAFETLHDAEQMPGQRWPSLHWPYDEGLRMDEAMHPLTLMVVGIYGEELPNQNGAPLRLMVPWKYGFKSIKSIVKIAFTEEMPPTAWNRAIPREYGFYANVNPDVDHPRWSQAKERRIGELFRRKTLPFNGYGEEVAHLYAGMDPTKLF